jgi:hypothetical protein
MKYDKVFIMSNVGATGGTELLHQLAYKLNKMGQPAYMVYSKPVKGSSVEKRFFIKYEVKVAESVEDNPRNLLVMPENILKYLPSYKHIQKAAWWLSVDNYSGARKGKCSLFRYLLRTALDKYLSLYDKQWEHYVQSEYARLYVVNERHITQTSVYNLSDYLNSEFIEKNKNIEFSNRLDNILYNPKKGIEVTRQIIQMLPQYNWVPIQGMTPDQICNLMRSSKLYIDFGNHPGKDRMPREAAICGCCIITGKRGAAANDVDIKIPSQYKISDSDISLIADRIKYVLKNYEDLTSDFDSYRDKIRHEEAVFDAEIKRIFID